MSYHLPVAVHVARREAARMIEHGRASLDAWEGFLDGLMQSVMARYASGRKLSGAGYATVVDEVRSALRGLAPVRLHEAALAPTRAHPKGEAHEFLALARYGNPDMTTARTGFVGLRVHVTRKRVKIDQEFVGLDVTRHTLERVVEREVATGPDGLARVEAALAAHLGLVVLWRWGILSRGLSPQVALPMGDGLLLGRIERVPAERLNLGYRLDRDGIVSVEVPQNDLQVSLDSGTAEFMPFLGSTAVDEVRLRLPQVDLRDALAAFSARHADFLEELGTHAAWASPDLHAREDFHALRERLDAAVDDLVRVLRHPALRGTLAPREETAQGVAYPAALMGDPQKRLDRICRGLRSAA